MTITTIGSHETAAATGADEGEFDFAAITKYLWRSFGASNHRAKRTVADQGAQVDKALVGKTQANDGRLLLGLRLRVQVTQAQIEVHHSAAHCQGLVKQNEKVQEPSETEPGTRPRAG
jgi:hypothetical protein